MGSVTGQEASRLDRPDSDLMSPWAVVEIRGTGPKVIRGEAGTTSYFHHSPGSSGYKISPNLFHHYQEARPENQVPPQGIEDHPESGRNFSSAGDSVFGQAWPLAWDPKFRPHSWAFGSSSSPDVPSSCRTFPNKRAHGDPVPSQGISEC